MMTQDLVKWSPPPTPIFAEQFEIVRHVSNSRQPRRRYLSPSPSIRFAVSCPPAHGSLRHCGGKRTTGAAEALGKTPRCRTHIHGASPVTAGAGTGKKARELHVSV